MGKDAIRLQAFYASVFHWKLSPPMPDMGNYSLYDPEGEGPGGGIGEGEAFPKSPNPGLFDSSAQPAWGGGGAAG